MLTEAEYAAERCKIGRFVHEHDGVWWETIKPYYTKPVFEFRAFYPGEAKPFWPKSFLGYSHQVPEQSSANRTLEFMILQGEQLKQFSMEKLRSEKRNQVRKGLRLCEIRPISDVEFLLEDMRKINVSQAKRVMEDKTFGLPYVYYIKHEQEWKENMRRQASFRGQEWLGAFYLGQLVAYMITCQVEKTLFIQAMKTHYDYLKLCATDAIYFTILEKASRAMDCERIVNGGPGRDGLNKFKEQFLFKRTEAFYYTSGAGLHKIAKAILNEKDLVRSYWQRLYGKFRTGKYLSSDQRPVG